MEDGQRRSSRYDAQGASFSLFRTPIRRVKTERQGDGRVCRVKRLCTARESRAFSAVGMAGGECLQCHVMDGSTIFRSENHRRMKPPLRGSPSARGIRLLVAETLPTHQKRFRGPKGEESAFNALAVEYLLHTLDIHKIVIYNIVYQDKGVKRHGGVQIRVHR